jgi:hypothetical protein
MVSNESDWHHLVKGMILLYRVSPPHRHVLSCLSVCLFVCLSIFSPIEVHSILKALNILLGRGGEHAFEGASARELVAAAVSRLCLVLCVEWGKPSMGPGYGFGFADIAPDLDVLPSSAMDFHRKLSGSKPSSRNSSISNAGEACS